jgi:hypothetical protein
MESQDHPEQDPVIETAAFLQETLRREKLNMAIEAFNQKVWPDLQRTHWESSWRSFKFKALNTRMVSTYLAGRVVIVLTGRRQWLQLLGDGTAANGRPAGLNGMKASYTCMMALLNDVTSLWHPSLHFKTHLNEFQMEEWVNHV